MSSRAFVYVAAVVAVFAIGCLKPYADPAFPSGTAIVPIRLAAHAPSLPMAGPAPVRAHVYDVGEACTEGPPSDETYLGVIALDSGAAAREIRVAAGHRLFLSFRLDSRTPGGARSGCDRSGWLVPQPGRSYTLRYSLVDGARCYVEVYEATTRRTSGLMKNCA